jgi:hypothetical protein
MAGIIFSISKQGAINIRKNIMCLLSVVIVLIFIPMVLSFDYSDFSGSIMYGSHMSGNCTPITDSLYNTILTEENSTAATDFNSVPNLALEFNEDGMCHITNDFYSDNESACYAFWMMPTDLNPAVGEWIFTANLADYFEGFYVGATPYDNQLCYLMQNSSGTGTARWCANTLSENVSYQVTMCYNHTSPALPLNYYLAVNNVSIPVTNITMSLTAGTLDAPVNVPFTIGKAYDYGTGFTGILDEFVYFIGLFDYHDVSHYFTSEDNYDTWGVSTTTTTTTSTTTTSTTICPSQTETLLAIVDFYTNNTMNYTAFDIIDIESACFTCGDCVGNGSCQLQGLFNDTTFDVGGIKCENNHWYRCDLDGSWLNLSSLSYGSIYDCLHWGVYDAQCKDNLIQYSNSSNTIFEQAAKICEPSAPSVSNCSLHVVNNGIRCIGNGVLQKCDTATDSWIPMVSYVMIDTECDDNPMYQNTCYINGAYTNQTNIDSARIGLCYPFNIFPTPTTTGLGTTTTTISSSDNVITDWFDDLGGVIGLTPLLIYLILMLLIGALILYFTMGTAYQFAAFALIEGFMVILGAVMSIIPIGIIIIVFIFGMLAVALYIKNKMGGTGGG